MLTLSLQAPGSEYQLKSEVPGMPYPSLEPVLALAFLQGVDLSFLDYSFSPAIRKMCQAV